MIKTVLFIINAMKKIMFISSGGGHLNELLQLEPLFYKYDSYLITEKTATTSYLKRRFDKVAYLAYGTKDHLLRYLFVFGFNILRSFYLFLKVRPDFIITTGTHTAVPMCYIGHIFKKKVVYIETFANVKRPTQAGKIVYKIADKFIIQWDSLKEAYPMAEYWGGLF